MKRKKKDSEKKAPQPGTENGEATSTRTEAPPENKDPASPEAGDAKQPPEPESPSLEQQVATLQDKLIRAQAEFDNSRKRLEREKWDAVRYANESLLESLLPVIDNFQLGLQAAEQGGDAKSIALGMEMVKNQLGQFLHDHEVREVDAAPGKPFDHNIHEALRQEPHDDVEAGHIVFCQRKGYHLRERLLRPALVVVAEKPGETKDTSD